MNPAELLKKNKSVFYLKDQIFSFLTSLWIVLLVLLNQSQNVAKFDILLYFLFGAVKLNVLFVEKKTYSSLP